MASSKAVGEPPVVGTVTLDLTTHVCRSPADSRRSICSVQAEAAP